MPYVVANAPAVFQEMMNKVLGILKRRAPVQEFIARGAEMEVHIDNFMLGTETAEDHMLLLRDFFSICEECSLRVKIEKCERLKRDLDYLGFQMGHGWWRPSSEKLEPLLSFTRRDDPVKGVKDIRSFVCAASFYRRQVKKLTFASAILTDLTKKNASWRWGDAEKKAFQDLKDKLKEVSVLGSLSRSTRSK